MLLDHVTWANTLHNQCCDWVHCNNQFHFQFVHLVDRSTLVSIEFACGKIPLRALKDGGVRRPGCLVLSQGALLKVFKKVLSEIWEPKTSQRERKRTVTNSKWSQTKNQHDPNGTKRVPTDAKVAPKSCLGAF